MLPTWMSEDHVTQVTFSDFTQMIISTNNCCEGISTGSSHPKNNVCFFCCFLNYLFWYECAWHRAAKVKSDQTWTITWSHHNRFIFNSDFVTVLKGTETNDVPLIEGSDRFKGQLHTRPFCHFIWRTCWYSGEFIHLSKITLVSSQKHQW